LEQPATRPYPQPDEAIPHPPIPIILSFHLHVQLTQQFSLRKYELPPAVKKLYQLRPKVTASSASVASRVVNCPAVSKELHQVHRKTGVYRMCSNWKVLTQCYCTLLYTKLYAHIQNCWMIPTVHSCYIVLRS